MHESHNRPARGRLRIFLGYAPGVGKTHTMLKAAEAARSKGSDIVIGYVDAKGSPELESLAERLESIPLADDRGVSLQAAMARSPDVVLVDDMAASSGWDGRRWRVVDELLGASMDVWTTLDVQQIERLSDTVARITGVRIRESVPDRFFDEADEIELVDLSPDELLARLQRGDVRIPEELSLDAERLFRKTHLIALRELAMRSVADRVGRRSSAQGAPAAEGTRRTTERLLVYVGAGESAGKLIRAAHRMAVAMRAEWVVVYSEVAEHRKDKASRVALARQLRFAEQLGAETVTLTGEDVVEEIVSYAAARNVTRIVVGKARAERGWRFWRRSAADRLTARCGDVDVYVIRSGEESLESAPTRALRSRTVRAYAEAIGLLTIATGIAMIFDRIGLTDATLVMTYLLAVVVAAVRLGRGPAILASVGGVLLFNFFFTTPYFTFIVDNPEYVYTFSVMLAIALIVSALTVRIREQAQISRDRERRMEVLYRVSHRLAGVPGELQLVQAAQAELVSIFSGEIVLFLPRGGQLRAISARDGGTRWLEDGDDAAQWVFDHREMAGWGTDAIADARAVYIPLTTPDSTVGVLAWRPENPEELLSLERRQLLRAIAAQIALALERDRLAQEAQQILAEAEAEKLRSSLLSAVSHDLRTPLTSIAGSAGMLVESDPDPRMRLELARTIVDEAERLNQLLENLLQMTRLESGNLPVRKEWLAVEELVEAAVRRLERSSAGRDVRLTMPDEMILSPVDGLLMEQVLLNLLGNAIKYSPDGSPIDVDVQRVEKMVQISVADSGIGLEPGEYERVFDKFYRSQRVRNDGGRGAGLGLAICRGVVSAHGGRIWAEPRAGGGTVFRFVIPAPPSGPGLLETDGQRDGRGSIGCR